MLHIALPLLPLPNQYIHFKTLKTVLAQTLTNINPEPANKIHCWKSTNVFKYTDSYVTEPIAKQIFRFSLRATALLTLLAVLALNTVSNKT